MQFREFGKWITRIADIHGSTQYTILAAAQEAAPVRALIVDLGIDDRFKCYEMPALTPGRMIVIPEDLGVETTDGIEPLIDALKAAKDVDFRQQAFEATAEAMEKGEHFRVSFPKELPASSERAG